MADLVSAHSNTRCGACTSAMRPTSDVRHRKYFITSAGPMQAICPHTNKVLASGFVLTTNKVLIG